MPAVSHWRLQSIKQARKILEALDDPSLYEAKQALRKGYPFRERNGFPYQAWREEGYRQLRAIFGRLVKIPRSVQATFDFEAFAGRARHAPDDPSQTYLFGGGGRDYGGTSKPRRGQDPLVHLCQGLGQSKHP